ncbi:MAG: DUF5615 family PIN-like protein [bacterium]
MRLTDFGLLTDENINSTVVSFLREQGFDVLDVKEAKLHGSSDSMLLEMAATQKRVVLTHDSDFGKLAIGSLEPIIGVVYPRPGHKDPSYTIATLKAVLQMELQVRPPFIVVGQSGRDSITIRVRQI